MGVYLYGASGHGKVIADILSASGKTVAGFIDDDPGKQGRKVGKFPIMKLESVPPKASVIVSIGHNATRVAKAQELESAGFVLEVAIHPSAIIARGVPVGPGTVVMAGAIVNSGAAIGRGVIVNTGATVDHDCRLEEGVHVSPGVHLAGNVRVGSGAHVGIGAAVIPGIRIGARSVVGAGSVVIRDVPPACTYVGNPARDIRNRALKRVPALKGLRQVG